MHYAPAYVYACLKYEVETLAEIYEAYTYPKVVRDLY